MKSKLQLCAAFFLTMTTIAAFAVPVAVTGPNKTPTPGPNKTPTPSPGTSDPCAKAGQPGQKECRVYSGKKLDGTTVTNELQCCFQNEYCDKNHPNFASRCYPGSNTVVCPIGRVNANGAMQGLACTTGTTCYQPTIGGVVKSYCLPNGETPCTFMGERLKTCSAAGRCSKLALDCVAKDSTEDATNIYYKGQTWRKLANGQLQCVSGCPTGTVISPTWYVPGGMVPPI